MVDFAKDQAFMDWLRGVILALIPSVGPVGGAYLTYASPSGANNNVNPGGGWPSLAGVPYTTLDVSLAAGNANWTGLLAGTDGQLCMIRNNDAANSLTLNKENAGSAAANRFSYPADLILTPRGTALAMYRTTPARWYLN
jgi:hypothetical protein